MKINDLHKNTLNGVKNAEKELFEALAERFRLILQHKIYDRNDAGDSQPGYEHHNIHFSAFPIFNVNLFTKIDIIKCGMKFHGTGRQAKTKPKT